ncbi:hypothetical protein GTY79_15365 [Streptomyces sp. SID8385]|nr:transposase [Streptomyces albidoflavus]MBK3382324.1 hypothetical protein [Streptomyces sp. DEF147AK]MBK3390864.1 hypothetical protein [Streptomyces sp. DEF1AK]MYX50559.1 hypothetical protein [Streptomyces sp. SID8385]BDH52233.1 hypothetical protein MTP02_32440 [Streptomyces albus]
MGSPVADQLASIGDLPPTVARAKDCRGLPARTRDAPNHRPLPGEAKTDAKEPAVITDARRTTPHTWRSLQLTDEITPS